MAEYNIQGGVHCADLITGGQHITYGFSAEDVERLIEKVLSFLTAGAQFVPEANGRVRAELDGESLTFRPGAAKLLAGQRNERSYLLSLTVHQDYLIWATNFIPLKANVDKQRAIAGLDVPLAFTEIRVPPPGSGPEAQITTEPLENITDAFDKHDAFIILGEPGAGKTTTLQKMVFDYALGCLEKRSNLIPFYARLSQQRESSPFEFLEKAWKKSTGSDFADALANGSVLLLLDGVNELPHEKRDERLNDWRLFAKQDCAVCKVAFSGREKDYQNSLDLPRVRVERLDEGRIADYLKRNQAEGLLDFLNAEDSGASRLRLLAENPLNLSLLAFYYRENGKSLDNRGKLFEWFAGALMAREKRDHPDNVPLEVRREALEKLAYTAQERGETPTLTPAIAKASLPASVEYKGGLFPIDSDEFFNFARGAKLLDPAVESDVRFSHQLFQEYFAALELLRRFNCGEDLSVFWRTPRTKEEMPPSNVGDWDPLPEPPTTGWEVTTILACGLSADPAKLIEAVRQHNPALAGRCIDEAGIPPLPVGEGPGLRVRQDLLSDLYNPSHHLRARLQAGFILGKIGDPRFEIQEINGVKVIRPQMVNVPAGKYLLGSKEEEEDSFDNESPQFTVDLPAFSIGKWSVTNAEFTCFMNAGGYENEDYWEGEMTKRWLKGEDVTGGQFKTWLDNWKWLQDNPNWKERFEQSGNYSPQEIEAYEELAKMTEDELKTELGKSLSQKSRSQPEYWKDRERNNPSQPVVGITWFEARAYCAWLSSLTGKTFRLPTEVEWEAAARGLPDKPLLGQMKARKFPWGEEWDKEKANSIEGRVLKPSPVGAYAAAGAIGFFKAEDQAGNVWDWTSSLYLPYPFDEKKSEALDVEGERVVRGGSWSNSRRLVRCADRGGYVPDFFGYDIGFRVVSPGSD